MRPAIAQLSARAQFRPWPRRPSICHLVVLDVEMVPKHQDVASWVGEVAAGRHTPAGSSGFESIRTGALFPAAAHAFRSNGFVEIDQLALLERQLLRAPGKRRVAPPGTTVRRLRNRELGVAASIDASCFDDEWANDSVSLREIISATPQARRRIVTNTSTGEPIGFSITGRAGPTGYLQRFAVRPEARRRGVADHLVDDACRWLNRRGAKRALVNTGVSNEAALSLYGNTGFHRLPQELVVLQLDELP